MKKRVLSVILAMVFCLSLLPLGGSTVTDSGGLVEESPAFAPAEVSPAAEPEEDDISDATDGGDDPALSEEADAPAEEAAPAPADPEEPAEEPVIEEAAADQPSGEEAPATDGGAEEEIPAGEEPAPALDGALDSGVWIGAGSVPWQIADDGTLSIGSGEFEIYTMENIATRSSSDYPWNTSAYAAQITSVRIVGTLLAAGSAAEMFMGLSNVSSFDLSGLDVSAATSIAGMFQGCADLTALDLSGWDTSGITNFSSLFSSCTSLSSLDLTGWDIGSADNLAGMFYGCPSLTSLDISGWNTAGVTDFSNMFWNCTGLTALDLSGWDTGSLTDMQNMFSGCSGLTSLDLSGWDTSGLTSIRNIFFGCSSLAALDVSGWDTSHVTNMSSTFYNCSSLVSLDLSGWDTSAATTMEYMFFACSSLAQLDTTGWDASGVTHTTGMFLNCTSLKELDLSTYAYTNANDMLGGLGSLEVLTLGPNCFLTGTTFDNSSSWSSDMSAVRDATDLATDFDADPAGMAGTYYAVYTVSFAAGTHGTGTMPDVYWPVASGTYTLPAVGFTADTGYEPTGWDLGAAGTDITLTGDTTVTAQWSLICTITFYDEDGTTVLDTQTVTYGTTPVYGGAAPTKAETAQYTYAFDAWTPAITVATGDAAYTASYTATLRSYTITWLDGDGNTLTTSSVTYGDTPVYAGATPTRTATAQYSYTFNGTWSPAIEAVIGEAAYTAQFDSTVNQYTITWSVEGTDTTETYDYGAAPVYSGIDSWAEPGFTKTISGWSPALAAVTGDETYTANITYVYNSFDVTYAYLGTVPAGAGALPAGGTYDYGSAVTVEADPAVPAGYTFSGWSRTGTFTMPAEDVEITGSFTASGTTPYTVEHYQQALDGSYTLTETEALTGATDTSATANPKTYEGFTFDSTVTGTVQTGAIAGDGSLVLKLYYTRNSYTVSYSYIGTVPAGAGALPAGGTYDYGSAVTVEADPAVPAGYTFSGWSRTGTFTMPAEDVEITGSFTASGTTPYTVEHYQQALDGSYTLTETESLTGATDTSATANPKAYEGFTFDSTAAGTVQTGTIAGDGSLVLKLYYTRRSFLITWSVNGTDTSEEYPYGAMPAFAGSTAKAPDDLNSYTFTGWDPAVAAVTGAAAYTAQYTAAAHSWTAAWAWAADRSTASVTLTCSDCGHTVTPAAAVTSAVTTPAACETAGVRTFTASATFGGTDYTDTQTQAIPALGHTYTGWTRDNTGHRHVCTRCGAILDQAAHISGGPATENTAETCTVCGYVIAPELGHIHANHLTYVAAKDPTCTQDGNRAYYACSCGRWYSDSAAVNEIADHSTMTVARLGHLYGEAWTSGSNGHWHLCTRCGSAGQVSAHISAGAPTVEHEELCAVCGYVMNPVITVFSSADYLETGDTVIPAVQFQKTKDDEDEWTVTLPEEAPVMPGYWFEGWTCPLQEGLFMSGEDLTFTYAEVSSISFTANWTRLIGIGTYDLEAGTRYRLEEGSFTFAGDDTVYEGARYFYLPSDGTYIIS